MSPYLYILGLIISSIILVVGLRNYWRKSWTNVRGSYSIASSRDCEDKYVSNITLENQKDRVVNIFAIYLQVGYAYHIKLKEFDEKPLILKPYETYREEFGPIEFYAVSSNKIDFNSLFDDNKVRKRLVLSTSQGRYVVTNPVEHWDPIIYFFKNHLSGTATPIPSKYKDKPLGSNIKFVIEFQFEEGREEVIPIHPRDHELKRFRSFQLTPESLNNKESLEEFLQEKQVQGVLNIKKFIVHDVDEWRKQSHDFFKDSKIKGRNYGFLFYYVVGKSLTWLSNMNLWFKNRKARKALRNK